MRILTFMFFYRNILLVTFIKGGTPAQIFLESASAMTRSTFVIFLLKLSSFIDWCWYYTQVSYTGSWESLVIIIFLLLYYFYYYYYYYYIIFYYYYYYYFFFFLLLLLLLLLLFSYKAWLCCVDVFVLFFSSCVPYVTSFSGLSPFDCPFGIL